MARLLILVGVLILVGGIYYFSGGTGVSQAPKAAQAPAEEPGYSARQAELIETGDDGRPVYTLVADRIREHPNDNRTQLDQPRMTFVASDGNTWHVQSRAGQIRDDGVNVILYGDVLVRGELPGSEAPAVIETSILTFDTKREIVTTHAPVTLDWNGRKLSGTGLTAKLPEHQVRLESRIHGSFPAPAK
ncbi:MAG TPA: LPS export ABC transporter periplasmic protein LptC [Steroidobacteraceae bacterium]|jgi:LPS export ABC transporter protein LptC|nr:LPS export ABC transporter periplasmic protein LptC [Steroidobacteraceae bacterium]